VEDTMPKVPLRVGRVVNCIPDLGVYVCRSAKIGPWGESGENEREAISSR
jgi:hypothetical protein